MMHPQVQALLATVKRGEAEEIEAARDSVRPELLPGLLEAYWPLPSWDDKAGLMQLFSDHLSTGGEKVMLDFLTAPTTELNDEYYTSGKIVALCQLAGTFEFYERLWYNRPLCAAIIQRTLSGERPSLAMVTALDQPKLQSGASKSQRKPLLARLPAWQQNILAVVFVILYGAAAFGLLYFLLSNSTRMLVSATILGLGAGGYLLYGAMAPKVTQGESAALRWLLALCGLFALGLASWAGFTLFSGGLADEMRLLRRGADFGLPDWASIFVILTLFVLPLLLTWGMIRWWEHRGRALQKVAQQEGEVFVIQPLNRWGVLLSAFGMLAIGVFLFILGRVDDRSLLELLFVPGMFVAMGVGMLAFFRHSTGLVLLSPEKVAVRRLWARERAMRYDVIESIHPMVFGVPPNMVLRGGGRKLRLPRTVHNLPRVYALLLERAPALWWQAPPALQRFTLPQHGALLNALERWLVPSQALVALELSPLEFRYQRKDEGWRERPKQDIARIELETIHTARRRFASSLPQINLDMYDTVVTFRDGERLRIAQRTVVQFGSTPEQLYLILQNLYQGR
ncbi:MAG: hypothetical protein RBT75_11555 [Anaerolineae bacterium]|jgi:hypothetical protein|nr:hypothetical protein [Anaerolineae bacterium]